MVKIMLSTLVVLVVMICVFVKIDPNQKTTNINGENSISYVEGTTISVKIEGQVLHPGTYSISTTSTIGELIEKAGGLLASADKSAINENAVIGDRTRIYIPTIAGYSDSCILEEAIPKVNINSASVEELASINGISLSLAEKIVDYRNQNGNFETIEDIQNVSGIGEKTYEKIRDYICIK